ncbi:TetR family transcriptional regulator [Acidicapsa ligni]|uniref:TetR family transcriptional regulator n=1 Tax=Acidicapsa ligni TaxID=542300 RepID=UPI0021DF9150|nr:TetR family transcriptional regulator [Acidicapsa ligni]
MTDSKNQNEQQDAKLFKQKRALLTRRELIRSARVIFARDGFEHARLEDIASNAGKTRGAFYANFKNKEDVFFAIFEEDKQRDMAELCPLLVSLPTNEQRIDALGEYLGELSKDRQRILLNLEFKLYAVRHPRKRKRLAELHSVMCLRNSVPELDRLLPQLATRNTSEELGDSLTIGGIIDGLALNHLFDPDAFDNREVARYLKLCLREMLCGIPEVKNEKEIEPIESIEPME